MKKQSRFFSIFIVVASIQTYAMEEAPKELTLHTFPHQCFASKKPDRSKSVQGSFQKPTGDTIGLLESSSQLLLPIRYTGSSHVEGNVIQLFDYDGNYQGIKYDNDGNLVNSLRVYDGDLFVGYANGQARIFDIETGKIKVPFNGSNPKDSVDAFSQGPVSVLKSPDGKQLWLHYYANIIGEKEAYPRGCIVRYDTKTGGMIGESTGVYDALSPDSTLGTLFDVQPGGNSFVVSNVLNGQKVGSTAPAPGGNRRFFFENWSQIGVNRTVAMINLFKPKSNVVVSDLEGNVVSQFPMANPSAVSTFKFNPSASELLVGAQNVIALFNAKKGTKKRQFPIDGYPRNLAIGDTTVAAIVESNDSGANQEIYVWENIDDIGADDIDLREGVKDIKFDDVD